MKEMELDIQNISNAILIHQVNAINIVENPLSKRICEEYPQHYEDYLSADLQIGSLVQTHLLESNLHIIGLVGQHSYGKTLIWKRSHTDYEAFESALIKVKHLYEHLDLPIYIPHNIGCNSRGGDKFIIHSIIERVIPNAIIFK